MIQVIGLREYTDKFGEIHTTDAFFDKKWRFKSVQEMFSKSLDLIAKEVPQAEHYNLFYTVAHCEESKGRVFEYQDVLPFDLDYVDYKRLEEYVKIFCDVLQVARDSVGIVASGNGLQFLVGINTPIFDATYFAKNKKYYNAICAEIMTRCLIEGLEIREVDTSVFKATQLMRLPYTCNRKAHGDRPVHVLNATVVPQDVNMTLRSGLTIIDANDACSDEVMKNFPVPDTKAVLEGCDFIRWAKDNQNDVREPQWFALLSTIGRLENGKQLAHDYSNQHAKYNYHRTETKLAHAMQASNPRTCVNINDLWGKCSTCKFYGQRKSPITITSPQTIKERHIGFYYAVATPVPGQFKQGKPNYNALMAKYSTDHNFVTNSSSGLIAVYRKTHWEDVTGYEVSSYCESHFEPKPSSSMCSEFLSKLQRNNLVKSGFFTTTGKVNLSNGVLDYKTGEVLPHSPKHGFKYVLPYDYDADAKCPTFDKFISDVTNGDKGNEDLILEYLGTILAYAPSDKVQKALVLTGEGSNGKSTFIDLIKALIGEDNFSTLTLGKELEKMENRYILDGKLCNISEETPTNSLNDSSLFKAVVTGADISARKLYADSYNMKANAKIILLCNALPKVKDMSYGFKRRLLIVDFKAKFTHEAKNIDVDIRDKMMEELSGIFNRALNAYYNLVKNKYRFTNHEVSMKRAEDYMLGFAEPWALFCSETIEKGVATDRVPSKALYESFRNWTVVNGVSHADTLSSIWLSRNVCNKYGAGLSRDRVNGVLISMLTDIKYIDESKEEVPNGF